MGRALRALKGAEILPVSCSRVRGDPLPSMPVCDPLLSRGVLSWCTEGERSVLDAFVLSALAWRLSFVMLIAVVTAVVGLPAVVAVSVPVPEPAVVPECAAVVRGTTTRLG